jgi:hypothetical protein
MLLSSGVLYLSEQCSGSIHSITINVFFTRCGGIHQQSQHLGRQENPNLVYMVKPCLKNHKLIIYCANKNY